MIIRGIELQDIDTMDIEDMARYERALNLVTAECSQIEGLTQTEVIKKSCNAVFGAFDICFGDGTARKLFGERTNLIECLQAFDEFISAVNKTTSESVAEVNRMVAKCKHLNRNSQPRKNNKPKYHNKNRQHR